jgi:hypothetical protein
MLRMTIVWFGLAIVLSTALYPQQIARAASPPTILEIIEGLEKQEELFFASRSLLIRHRRIKSEDDVESQDQGNGLLLAEYAIAYRNDMWFMEKSFLKPRTTAEGVWIPGEPITYVLKDGFVLEWSQYATQASVQKVKEWSNFYNLLIYTRNLSFNAPKFITRANGFEFNLTDFDPELQYKVNHPYLPAFLRTHQAEYRVRDEPEVIDGLNCWIVEWPGMDQFSICVERGFAVPQRKYSWEPGKPTRYEFLNSNYREVKKGLWLPYTLVEYEYANLRKDNKEFWGKVDTRSEYQVETIEFDRLDDSFFDRDLSKNTRVYDAVRDLNYSVAGDSDADPFEFPIIEGRNYLKTSSRKWLLLNLLVLAIVVPLLGYFWWSGRRKSSVPPGN